MSERKEAFFRIIIGIVSGIIIGLWGNLIGILSCIHWIYTIISGKRSKSMADFTNLFVSEAYHFYRYIYLITNKRPFPFRDITTVRDKVDMKVK